MESYVDKHHAATLGVFSTTPWENHEDYIKPQENGSHYGCLYVLLADEASGGLAVLGEEPFSFTVSPYTQEALTDTAHNFELEPCGDTVLCVDMAQSGLGSNSCGPQLLEKYRLDAGTFSFRVELVPFISNKGENA